MPIPIPAKQPAAAAKASIHARVKNSQAKRTFAAASSRYLNSARAVQQALRACRLSAVWRDIAMQALRQALALRPGPPACSWYNAFHRPVQQLRLKGRAPPGRHLGPNYSGAARATCVEFGASRRSRSPSPSKRDEQDPLAGCGTTSAPNRRLQHQSHQQHLLIWAPWQCWADMHKV